MPIGNPIHAVMISLTLVSGQHAVPASTNADLVRQTPGLVAFWELRPDSDGVIRSSFDRGAFSRPLPLHLRRIGDPKSYSVTDWPYGEDPRSAIAIDRSGPFGHALGVNRGYLYAESPRSGFDKSALDLSGRKPFTMIAWVKYTGERHMIAGIWDEGGWDRYSGRRQAALFAGLFGQKGVIAHISATGAASYPQSTIDGSQYARRRAIDGQPFDDHQWIAAAMTYDPRKQMVTAWLNGRSTRTEIVDPVEQEALGLTGRSASNPYRFESRIFSPFAPTLKFNGYDWKRTGIAEHRLALDLERGSARYEREQRGPNHHSFRLTLTADRSGQALFAPIVTAVRSGHQVQLPVPKGSFRIGDRVIARLDMKVGHGWKTLGTPIAYTIREGAPFTIGRALGLGQGADSIDHGSQMLVDGVAVFNRVLSPKELQRLSFRPDGG